MLQREGADRNLEPAQLSRADRKPEMVALGRIRSHFAREGDNLARHMHELLRPKTEIEAGLFAACAARVFHADKQSRILSAYRRASPSVATTKPLPGWRDGRWIEFKRLHAGRSSHATFFVSS